MTHFRVGRDAAAVFLLLGSAIISPAAAASWGADADDAQLRADIELLAATGVIDSLTSEWPLAWGAIQQRLENGRALSGQSAAARGAARRVLAQADADTEPSQLRASLDTGFTNAPATIRGFDGLNRQDAQGQAILDYAHNGLFVHLAAGARSTTARDRQLLMLDGSYAATEMGGAVIYAGYVPRWWGPGWRSALSLSSNARPFPSIGITRASPKAFETPILSWLGPWQAEFFVGVLDGQRIASNTLFNGLRVTINPLPGLELALARTQQSCGTGQPCKPFQSYFDVYNDPVRTNNSKEQVNFDLRYTKVAGGIPFSLYGQVMNRDTGPFTHSASSHLFGATLWLPVDGTMLRLTAEYASTISTQNFFSFGKYLPGITYEDSQYADGWTYRGLTMGSSLGTDSRLATLQAGFLGRHDIRYSVSLDHADLAANRLSSAPVVINAGEVRLGFPLGQFQFDIAGRYQDDQPRPRSGGLAAVETRIRMAL